MTDPVTAYWLFVGRMWLAWWSAALPPRPPAQVIEIKTGRRIG